MAVCDGVWRVWQSVACVSSVASVVRVAECGGMWRCVAECGGV